MSALIRKMKDQATLDNPIQATHLMDIASKSLTVDDGIASVSKLLDLANTLKKVPTQNITFLTMPTVPYAPDPNRVAPDTDLDDQIFSLIAHDQSVTGPTTTTSTGADATPTTPSPTPTASTSLSPSAVTERIVVENGTANDGRSRQLAATLTADGFKNTSGVGYSSSDVATTTVFYSTQDHQAAAQAVAASLQLPASAVQQGGDGSAPIVVRVGADFASGDVYNPGAASASSSDSASSLPSALPSDALSSAGGENAADQNLCVEAKGS